MGEGDWRSYDSNTLNVNFSQSWLAGLVQWLREPYTYSPGEYDYLAVSQEKYHQCCGCEDLWF
jgi:hypothetical protein